MLEDNDVEIESTSINEEKSSKSDKLSVQNSNETISDVMFQMALRRRDELETDMGYFKTNAGIVLGVSGIILTVSLQSELIENPFMVVSIILMVFSVILILYSLLPQKMDTMGIEKSWNEIAQEADDVESLKIQLISNLVEIEKRTMSKMKKLWNIYFFSVLFLVAAIILLPLAVYS